MIEKKCIDMSVIMSIYNEPIEWVKQSINSILNQTFNNFEFIIINDNPERLSNNKLLKQYKEIDPRVLIISNKQNIGLTKSLNIGLEKAKGKYIARMDADDISYKERLEKQFEFLELNPDYIVCGTQIKFFGDQIKSSSPRWIKFNDFEIKSRLLLSTVFAHPTVMIRRDVLLKNNLKYDESFKQAQDYSLWVALYPFGKFHNLEDVFLDYRISDRQITSKSSCAQANYVITIRKKHLTSIISKEFVDQMNSSELNLSFLIKIKKYFKDKRIDKNIKNNIIYLVYLSIKKRGILVLLYYFFSLDFLNKTEDYAFFKIIENIILPSRKPKRL